MKRGKQVKVVAIVLVGCLALSLFSKSIISFAREIVSDYNSVDNINDVMEVKENISQRAPSRYMTQGQLSIDMLDQQLEGSDVVELKNSNYLDYTYKKDRIGEKLYNSYINIKQTLSSSPNNDSQLYNNF